MLTIQLRQLEKDGIVKREVFVIGGADLINQSLVFANRIYITEVKAQIEGDTYLQNLNLDTWKTISQKDFLITPGGNEYDFSIIEYGKDL